MAFLRLFSGVPSPKGNYHKKVTLMSYINKVSNPPGCQARKYCYIIDCNDLQKIFTNAGIKLKSVRKNTFSFWNRRLPKFGKEFGVEIC